ncbi:MAG: YkgJ family cysteine cluster protein [Nitrospinaceae bacterium]|jgi:hypothetical protein|nr:YkgJ family cysteine cluster protein [Nitrospinaceae bacterium]MDP7147266.1 YkgJ family cysteine cluster protein [Nitrospinaceae bacterium]MDP7611681.1 YkgJ family cysteine cluster protein [Nitrospinaceae bacterium]|tara:strand:+ start:5387 stop:5818 length:432 start_codon:yes stop_codon:yes gene_type:complete
MTARNVITREKWWEKEPLRFECQDDCFKCCTKPGIVYFDKAAIKNGAGIINVSVEVFKKEFLKKDDGHWMHEVENGNPCAFLIPDGCAIHNGKPLQCRSYPFWHENMTSKSMWKLVEGFCPGVGVGPAATVATIRQFLAKFKL